MKFRAGRIEFYSFLQQNNRIFIKLLLHAEARHEENYIGILRREFACSNQQFQRFDVFVLISQALREEVKRFRRVAVQFKPLFQCRFCLGKLAVAQICLAQIVQYFDSPRLQCIGNFEFVDCGLELFLRS